MWKRMNGMDKKLWAVLASNIAILGAIVALLVKAVLT